MILAWDMGCKDTTAVTLYAGGKVTRWCMADPETWMAWLEAMRADAGRPDYPLVLTPDLYRTWKAHSGNAKARRRWRRRNLPNSQRPLDITEEEFRAMSEYEE